MKIKTLFCFFIFTLLFASCSRHAKYERIVRPPVVQAESGPNQWGLFAETPYRSSVQKGLIVIDPGHGGEDYGTHSTKGSKYQEKSLNLATAMLVREYLQKMGYQIEMTRSSDNFIALDKRASMANDLKPKLFVSVHYNSAPSKEAEGIEVYYFKAKEDPTRSDQSRNLASAVLEGVIKNTAAKSRGVKHGNYAVIRETKMPAILIEGGFLTNESEAVKIKNPTYMKQLAWGIAQGVNNYLTKGN